MNYLEIRKSIQSIKKKQKILAAIVKIFLGSSVLTHDDMGEIYLEGNNRPAEPGRGRAACGSGRHEQAETYDFSDLLYPEGGHATISPPAKVK